MNLHFTERIINLVHDPRGRPYPTDLVMVYGLYPDPPPDSRDPNSGPPTHFYSIQWPYISQSGFIDAYTILREDPIHRTW